MKILVPDVNYFEPRVDVLMVFLFKHNFFLKFVLVKKSKPWFYKSLIRFCQIWSKPDEKLHQNVWLCTKANIVILDWGETLTRPFHKQEYNICYQRWQNIIVYFHNELLWGLVSMHTCSDWLYHCTFHRSDMESFHIRQCQLKHKKI